jgi:hypothetical protein
MLPEELLYSDKNRAERVNKMEDKQRKKRDLILFFIKPFSSFCSRLICSSCFLFFLPQMKGESRATAKTNAAN